MPTSAPDDSELVERVRQGFVADYAILFARHYGSGLRYATSLAGPSAADDLVADAFAQTLMLLRSGRGPVNSFRAYLLVAIRSHHVNRLRRQSRLVAVGHHDELEAMAPSMMPDGSDERFEATMARRAFASLPPRWRQVLWLTSVEGRSHPEIADLVGMSPNAVAVLAYRAREGLRRAFIAAHLEAAHTSACASAAADLPAHTRQGLTRQRDLALRAHLEGCADCRDRLREAEAVAGSLGRPPHVA